MKLAVTVNLGNYENIRIESSEQDNISECKTEIDLALEGFRMPQADDFRKRVFRYSDDGQVGDRYGGREGKSFLAR